MALIEHTGTLIHIIDGGHEYYLDAVADITGIEKGVGGLAIIDKADTTRLTLTELSANVVLAVWNEARSGVGFTTVEIKQQELLPTNLQLLATVVAPGDTLTLPWESTLGYLIASINIVSDQPVRVYLDQSTNGTTPDLIPVAFTLSPTIGRSLAALITSAYARIRIANSGLVPATVTLMTKFSPVGTPQEHPDQHKISAAASTLIYDVNGNLIQVVKDLGVGVLFTKTYTWANGNLVGISVWETVAAS